MKESQLQLLVEALSATGWRLWTTSHNNTPAAQRVHQWMRAIAPGQLVLEITAWTRGKTIDRVGELLTITSAHEFTIRTVDDRVQRWENADFVRIPRNEEDNREIYVLGDQSIRLDHGARAPHG